MDRRSAVAIALGGIVGAAARWSIVEVLDGSDAQQGHWPWGVFVANLLGCALLGVAVSALRGRDASTVLGVTVGFCGALTTFSAFALDLALFLRGDHHATLVGYLLLSFVLGAIAYVAGRSMGRRLGNPA
ncbi:MAG: CrcB family protein [Actinomycetota bacterium]